MYKQLLVRLHPTLAQCMLVLAALLLQPQLFAQQHKGNLFESLEYQKAFKNGTRLRSGQVSDTYWQNKSSYAIKATVDPQSRILSGYAKINYQNNSPDSLRKIVFQSYHNLYKPIAQVASPRPMAITKGVIVEEVKINGVAIDLENKKELRKKQNLNILNLANALAPNTSINIEVKWNFEVPLKYFRRSGAIDSSSMFIGYWYPEIAVYDDIEGWDTHIYDGGVEFYHDFSDFDVEIEVPNNFFVWASVAPENAKSIYPKKVLKRIKKAQQTSEKVEIITKKDLEKGLKTKSNVWKYNMKDTPDFCFALSNHYVWEACTYTDSVGSFFLSTVYNPERAAFKEVLRGEKLAIETFHTQFPKYPFPYRYFTIFQGLPSGGMEYPGMANNAVYSGKLYSDYTGQDISDFRANYGLTLHEMTHMYFPFLMGIHEKKHTWMEEGWADFADYFNAHDIDLKRNRSYLGKHATTPIWVPSYTQAAYHGVNSYTMAAISYYSLYHMLGKETFFEALHTYMNRWKHKHPSPYDFLHTISNAAGEDLSWFWKRWYFDWAYPDVAIQQFENNSLTLENKGGRPVAVELNYYFDDDSTATEIINPKVWKDSATFNKTVSFEKPVKKIVLKTYGGQDSVHDNSVWEAN